MFKSLEYLLGKKENKHQKQESIDGEDAIMTSLYYLKEYGGIEKLKKEAISPLLSLLKDSGLEIEINDF